MGKPKGKYAHITARLPKYIHPDVEYAQRVTDTKNALKEHAKNSGAPLTASIIALHYAQLRKEKEDFDVEERALNLLIAAHEALLDEYYEIEGITSLKLDTGGSVRVQYEPYASVKDKETFRRWCAENGLEQQMVLPWQTTNAITKERLLEGETEPPGVQASTKLKVVYTKGDDPDSYERNVNV